MALYDGDDDPNPQALRLRLLAGALLALFVGLFVLFGGLAAVRPDVSPPDGPVPVEDEREPELQDQSAVAREHRPGASSNAETAVARDPVTLDIPRGALRLGWTSPVSPATGWEEGERPFTAERDELALKAQGTAGSTSAAAGPPPPTLTAHPSSVSNSSGTSDEASTRSASPPTTPVVGAEGQSVSPGRPLGPLDVTQPTATPVVSDSTQIQDGCEQSDCSGGSEREREDQDQPDDRADLNEDAVHEQADKDKDKDEDEHEDDKDEEEDEDKDDDDDDESEGGNDRDDKDE